MRGSDTPTKMSRLCCGVTSLLCVLLLGCSGAAQAEPTFHSDDPDAQAAFDEARGALATEQRELARTRFESVVINHPEDPLRRAAEYHLGLMAIEAGDHQTAVTWLEAASASTDEALALRAKLSLGQSLVQLRRHGRALEVLEPLVGRLPQDQSLVLFETLAEASEQASDVNRRVRYLDGAAQAAQGQERAAHESTIATLVESLGEDELTLLQSQLPPSQDGVAWAQVTLRLAHTALESGNAARATELVAQLDAASVSSDAVQNLRQTLEEMARVDFAAVGVLLPLSGRARLVGEMMRRGLELAAGPQDQPGALRLVFRDTAAEGANVESLVTELVETERVVAIIGPVDSASAALAASQAEQLHVPLLTLTIRSDVTATGSWVLRAFQSNEADVRALVSHSMSTLGLQTFAVLHPDNSFGRVLSGLFSAQVTAQGGTVVAAQSYNPSQTSFVEECQHLADQQFDAIFIPGSARSVALLAPALAAAGLFSQPAGGQGGPSGTRPVQLLVPSSGFGSSVVRQAGRYLQGALFSTPFWADSVLAGTAPFVERYSAAHNQVPTAYASQAHDAIVILRRALEVAELPTRHALLEALLTVRNAETAGPFAGFEPGGEPRTPMQLLTVAEQAFVAAP